jgi:hypothetical protein
VYFPSENYKLTLIATEMITTSVRQQLIKIHQLMPEAIHSDVARGDLELAWKSLESEVVAKLPNAADTQLLAVVSRNSEILAKSMSGSESLLQDLLDEYSIPQECEPRHSASVHTCLISDKIPSLHWLSQILSNGSTGKWYLNQDFANFIFGLPHMPHAHLVLREPHLPLPDRRRTPSNPTHKQDADVQHQRLVLQHAPSIRVERILSITCWRRSIGDESVDEGLF